MKSVKERGKRLCVCNLESKGWRRRVRVDLRMLTVLSVRSSTTKAPLIKVHENNLCVRHLCCPLVCVHDVCLVVLHPTVLLDESVDHLLHGQIGDQLILGQWAAGYWVKMTNTL